MGQIKAVYPTSYRLRQEKNIPTFSSGVKKSDYQLTLEPMLGEGGSGGGSCGSPERSVLPPPRSRSWKTLLGRAAGDAFPSPGRREAVRPPAPLGVAPAGAQEGIQPQPGEHRQAAPRGEPLIPQPRGGSGCYPQDWGGTQNEGCYGAVGSVGARGGQAVLWDEK